MALEVAAVCAGNSAAVADDLPKRAKQARAAATIGGKKRPLYRQIVMGAAGIEPDRPVMH
jgi:hypothetical protein